MNASPLWWIAILGLWGIAIGVGCWVDELLAKRRRK